MIRRGVKGLRLYELLLILDPRPTDEEVSQILAKLQENLKALGAEIQRVENWGKRRMTYEIRKQREGTYAVFELSAEPAMVKEFERQLGLNENVLRFMSTRVPARERAAPTKPEEALEEVG